MSEKKISGFSVGKLKKRIKKNFTIGFIASVIVALLGLMKTAILVKSLSVADFGLVLIILNLFAFLLLIVSFRVQDVIYRFYPVFISKNDRYAINRLIWITGVLSLGTGLLVASVVAWLGDWLASSVYDAPELVDTIYLYTVVVPLLALEPMLVVLLRLHNQFARIAVLQVLGELLIVLGFVFFVLVEGDAFNINLAISVIGAGIVFRISPMLFMAFRNLMKDTQNAVKTSRKDSSWDLREVFSVLFHTNITGYLKVGSDTGGMFLLGILATSTEVAIFGLARQLVKPFTMFQNNLSSAITPEVMKLVADGNLVELNKIIGRFLRLALVAILVLLPVGIFAAPYIVNILANEEYTGAVLVFDVMFVSALLALASLWFYAVAVATDRVKQRNKVVALRFIFLIAAIIVGLDALTLAIAQLMGVLAIKILFDLPMMKFLQREARNEGNK